MLVGFFLVALSSSRSKRETTRKGERRQKVDKFRAVGDQKGVRSLGDPRKPSAAEVEEHEKTHLPYRN